jgi:hypothetical protein
VRAEADLFGRLGLDDDIRPACCDVNAIDPRTGQLNSGEFLHRYGVPIALNQRGNGKPLRPAGKAGLKLGQEPRFRSSGGERGSPPVARSDRTGFGSLVLQRLVAGTLSGEASQDFAPEGSLGS